MMILFLSMEVCMKMGDNRVAIWYVNQQLEDIAKERGNPSRMYRKLLQFQLLMLMTPPQPSHQMQYLLFQKAD